MEDEESGDSACNSSDGGGSRSWAQSPSYEPTQLLYSKEGAFGQMESTQLLSNDFYTKAFSGQKQEESDEEFVEDDELEALREQHKQIGVDEDEDEGSQSDYEGDYEETQLLEQYNAHYNKTEYVRKTGHKTGHTGAGFLDNNQESSGEEEGDCEETQLLEPYNTSSYNKAEYEKEQLMQVPKTAGKSKAIGSWQHENVGSRVSTEDGGNSVIQRKQDQQEMLFRDRPKSELAQERICEFDMDLNVSLEEEMDCEYYGEPVNFNTQLVANSGYYNDTQLVTSSEKGCVDKASFGTNNKPVVSSGKEATTDYKLFTNGGKPNNSLLITNSINVDLRRDNDTHILKQNTDVKVPSSSHGEIRSFTTGITMSAKQSGSEASESTPFQSNIGSIHAESIRISAVQPIAWHPKVEFDASLTFSNTGGSHLLKKQGDKGKKSVESGSLPWQLSTTEPEWMRKYEGSGSLRSRNVLDQNTRSNSTSYLLPPPVEKGTIANNEKADIADRGGPSRPSFTPGTKPLLGSSIFSRGGYFQGKPAGSFGGSDKKTTLLQQSAFGTGLSSPMSRLNYLDSADPGEDVQAEALDMVDKLVWLNTNDSVKDEPPKKPKKFFSSLPLASSARASDPALQVYEFEDTPQEDPVQKYGDMSFIKEIQAGWKKKADQGHLFSTLKKGKERDIELLPEGERLSKLLNEEKRELSFEPPQLVNGSNRKRLSTRLQGKLKENLENATQKNLNTDGIGANEQIAEPRSDTLKHQSVKLEEKQLKTSVGLVEDDDSGMKPDIEIGGNLGQEYDGDDKGSVAAHILTRRRTQGRNRREHIWSPDAVFLTENFSFPDKMDKSPNMSRKRKSLNIMLREQRTRKTRRKKGEEHVDNSKNEVHDNSWVGNGNIISTSAQKRSRALSRKEEDEAEDVDSETLEEGRKKIKLLEASMTRLPGTGDDDKADEPVDNGLRTRSLRNLPGRKFNGNNNHPNPTEPFRNGLVQKKLRSVRRGHGGGGGPGGLILADEGDKCDDGEVEVQKEFQKEFQKEGSSTNTSAATTSKDDDNQEDDGLEVDDDDDDDISSPVKDDEDFLFEKPSPIVLLNAEENAGVVLPRGRMKRTRSIADVSSPTTPTPILQPIPFPLVTGRRGRGAIVKPENMEDDRVLQSPTPPFVVPVAAGKGLRMRTMRKRKDPQMLAFASGSFLEIAREESASVSTEGSGRSRRRASVCVLFSHGLAEDTIKKQRKILEKLDGKVATKAADCTHFVAEKFVRTGNMLEAMAAGKYVVTFAWLESCEIANCFIDERNFILEDERKEKDMAFSMCTTLSNAQHKPLLQGVRVLLTPNITPKPQAIANIVHAAGGEVVEVYKGPSPDVDSKDFCMVISNEDDYEVCVPLLEQGAKVYKTELILSGIVSYRLDFSKHILFEGYKSGRRRVGRVQLT